MEKWQMFDSVPEFEDKLKDRLSILDSYIEPGHGL